MKKFMNAAATLAQDSLNGFVAAHADIVVFGAGQKFVRRRVLSAGKVSVISGGGAGHEPMHSGFVGHGMLDAACIGHVFTSPTPDQIVAAIRETESGAGTLLIVKNYDGDLMNFEMAVEMAAAIDRPRVATVVVNDDIAVERSARGTGRRGVAGTLVVEKIVGAAAQSGTALDDLKLLGDAVVAATRTMGVALTGTTVPQTTRETFTLDAQEMEIGVGIHGEPGRARVPMADASAIVDLICGHLLDDLGSLRGRSVLLFVNGLGGTPLSELYLVFGLARSLLERRGATVARSLVGVYVTSLDMAGMSITITVLNARLTALWDAPVTTASLRW